MKEFEGGREAQQDKTETGEGKEERVAETAGEQPKYKDADSGWERNKPGISEVTAESPESPITTKIKELKKSVRERGRLTPKEFTELQETGTKYIEVGTITASGAFRRTGALVRDPQNSDVWHLIFSEKGYDDPEFQMSGKVADLLKADALYIKNGNDFAKGIEGAKEGLVMENPETVSGGGKFLDTAIKVFGIKGLESVTPEAITEAAKKVEDERAKVEDERAEARRKTFQKALETGRWHMRELNPTEAAALVAKYNGGTLEFHVLETMDDTTANELAKFKGEVEFVDLDSESRARFEKARKTGN